MKKLLLILLCLPMIGFGQDDFERDDITIFRIVDEMPVFPCMDFKFNSYDANGEIIGYRTREYCGQEGLVQFIQKNVRYPSIAKEYNIQGKVYVQFLVEKDGSISNVEIVRGVDENLDKEALRLVKLLPKFNPGKQRGKPVRVYFTIPINFMLN